MREIFGGGRKNGGGRQGALFSQGKTVQNMSLIDCIKETSRIRRRWYGRMMAHQSEEAQAAVDAGALVQIEGEDHH